ITSNGKSICRVNGKLTTLAILKEFGKVLIDIHSQHETQSLMDRDQHIHLLDLYDRKRITKAKENYSVLYDKLVKLKKRYEELNENEREMAQRLDLLEFQKHEIESASLVPNEDEELEQERSQLANYERIYNSIHDAYNALYGEQKAIDWLNLAQQSLQNIKEYDESISDKAEQLSSSYYIVEELAFDLRSYLDTLHFDSQRLNEIESRLDEINRLKRKYGTTVNDILEYAAKIEEEIEQIKNKDSHLSQLKKQIDEMEQDAFLEAKQLHDIRRESARLLTEDIKKELKELYMDKASFSVVFETKPYDYNQGQLQLHENGFDHIHFEISTNPGEPLKELGKVASGGELSRIMLALKKIFSSNQRVTRVIFDEVDTGVSGRVAQSVAEKIQQISKTSQVLCITHLPQVAAMADTHKLIAKEQKGERTTTTVSELNDTQKMEELSRMITGTKLTETAKEHAKELLELASAYKMQNE